ncbi:MAG: hypothetical protein KTR28_08930 [Micavibrio sp.]|nr:hypothetical protein [Micavibrio sp.]
MKPLNVTQTCVVSINGNHLSDSFNASPIDDGENNIYIAENEFEMDVVNEAAIDDLAAQSENGQVALAKVTDEFGRVSIMASAGNVFDLEKARKVQTEKRTLTQRVIDALSANDDGSDITANDKNYGAPQLQAA